MQVYKAIIHLFIYICVDRYVPISESHQQMQELMFYECLGHTGAEPFSLQMSRYDFFFLSLGTGGTFSCCCMHRSISLQAGDRMP